MPDTFAKPSHTRLKVWGTSRAVRIPKRFCDDLGIAAESVLVMEEAVDEQGPYLKLRAAESDHRSYSDAPIRTMDELFRGYDYAYEPQEADWGDDVGSEVVA